MLVLTRRKSEQLVIVPPSGEEIVITVVNSYKQGEKIKLGVDADKSVKIFRREIYDQIQSKENQ